MSGPDPRGLSSPRGRVVRFDADGRDVGFWAKECPCSAPSIIAPEDWPAGPPRCPCGQPWRARAAGEDMWAREGSRQREVERKRLEERRAKGGRRAVAAATDAGAACAER